MEGVETAAGEGRSLRPKSEEEGARTLGVPFAAMAEALRANAEAIERIDATQRKIAETLEKGEKASNVVASTRALNDTFRGLGEIQRGLLDAVTKDRGRSRGMPLAIGAIALLAGLVGILGYDRLRGDRSVDRATYADARARADELQGLLADARVREQEEAARRRSLEERLSSAEAAFRGIEAEKAALLREREDLRAQAKAGGEKLSQFLEVKERADKAAILELEAAQLQARVRAAEERLERSEKERERLAALLIEDRYESRKSAEAQKVLDAAKEKGLLPKEEPAAPDGSLAPKERRLMIQRVGRLLKRASGEEAYELLDVRAAPEGSRFLDVKLGHYEGPHLLNTVLAARMEIFGDEAGDTVELRIEGGGFVNPNRVGETIAFPDGRHSIFLSGVSLKDFLEKSNGTVSRDPDGRLRFGN